MNKSLPVILVGGFMLLLAGTGLTIAIMFRRRDQQAKKKAANSTPPSAPQGRKTDPPAKNQGQPANSDTKDDPYAGFFENDNPDDASGDASGGDFNINQGLQSGVKLVQGIAGLVNNLTTAQNNGANL